MKKFLLVSLAVVIALGAVAFAACGTEQTVEGEYSYVNPYQTTQTYGCKVSVTVKSGVITSVTVTDDTETYYNVSSGWEGKQTWIDGKAAMVASFKGLTVEQVNAITVPTKSTGDPDTATGISGAPAALKVVSGATMSSGRLILAVQNALSKLK